MIAETDLKQLIAESFPEADIAVFDTNGLKEHYRLWVSSAVFQGKNPIQRRQMVYKAIQPAFDDQRLHAVEITTDVPDA